MIQEDYVSFEVAKLLKEKGFDEICSYEWGVPDIDGGYILQKWSIYNGEIRNSELIDDAYAAPTHQMACKWLREIHNKHCDIGYDIDLEWYFQIIDLKETVEYDYPEIEYYHAENETGFKTYEEAVEAAIKYTLENLL